MTGDGDDITTLAQQIRAKAQSGFNWNVEHDWEKVNDAEKAHWLKVAHDTINDPAKLALKRLDGGS